MENLKILHPVSAFGRVEVPTGDHVVEMGFFPRDEVTTHSTEPLIPLVYHFLAIILPFSCLDSRPFLPEVV